MIIKRKIIIKNASTQSLNDVGIMYDFAPQSDVLASLCFSVYPLKFTKLDRDIGKMKLSDLCGEVTASKHSNRKSSSELSRD
mmetsp:Transcript_11510/g.14334  ORF Transcript_11510/g.14334 Transcript_11510/m.14334 type:complete len:82 (-) Transcript_11510:370-615(-)